MPDSQQYLQVVRVDPRKGWSTDVSTLPEIRIWFNVPVDQSLVGTDAVLNQYIVLVNLATDEPVPVTFQSWDNRRNLLTIVPSRALSAGGLYQVTVRRDLKSVEGRQMVENRVWTFQVSSSSLDRVVLRLPGDATAHSAAPVLQWNGVGGSAATGTIYYDVQLDNDWHFTSLLWSTTVTASGSGGVHSVAIGTPLDAEKDYYWRVRARTDAVTGEWSDAWAFWIGSLAQPAPDTVQTYHPEAVFRVVGSTLMAGLGNLSQWPKIEITFSSALDGATVLPDTVKLFADRVDGSPDFARQEIVLSIVVSGSVLTVVPVPAVEANRRYTLFLSRSIRDRDGRPLGEDYVQSFTSSYKPLYGGVVAVRQALGALVTHVTDDDIWFQLWRASLKVNELLITRNHRFRHTVTFNELVNYLHPGGVVYGMARYAEVSAAIALLNSYYFDALSEAGRREAIGVFEYEVDIRLLEEIRARLDELAKELGEIEAFFFKYLTVPRTVRKGQYWEPYSSVDVDRSFIGRSQI